MALVKVSKANVWRGLWEDPTLVPTTTPQFPPGVLDFTFYANVAAAVYLPAAVRSGSPPTYTMEGLPAGVGYDADARTIWMGTSGASPVERHKAIYTATYTDGKTATKDITVTIYPAPPAVVLSPFPTNVHLESIRYFTGIQSAVASVRNAWPQIKFVRDMVIAWIDPADTSITQLKVYAQGHYANIGGSARWYDSAEGAPVARGVQRYETTRNYGQQLTNPIRVGDRLSITVESQPSGNQNGTIYVVV